jgi:HEPN domain-containing protein
MTSKKEVIKLWLAKAESDLKTAQILIKDKDPPTDSICFHAQQAVEKLLKAYLTYFDIKVPKTHDIATLLKLCLEVDKDFKELDLEKLEELTFYAVEVRYPDAFYQPSKEEAKEALHQAIHLKKFVLKKLEKKL